jgi:hypothetical protein
VIESASQALIASHTTGSSNHKKHCKGNDTQILPAKPRIMIDQPEQLQKELHFVRTQREAANRVHQERVRKSHQQQQALRAEIHSLLRRGVMPHEARAALESGSSQRLVVPYALQKESLVIATARHADILHNAMVTSKEKSEIMRKFMVSQLVSVEFERISSRLKFNKRREALVAGKKEISNYYGKVIQPENKLLDRLDPQRIPKTLQGFLGKIKPFFRELNRGQFAADRAA